MCRLYACLAAEPRGFSHDLVHGRWSLRNQSAGDRAGLRHPHGCGIGYYDGRDLPTVGKWPEPASTCAGFAELAREVHSSGVVAHIRYRTVGPLDLAHTQPYVRADWLLAGTGGIGGGAQRLIRGAIAGGEVKSRTSAEHLLVWFRTLAGEARPPARTSTLAQALGDLLAAAADTPPHFSFALLTGDCLYAFVFTPEPDVRYTLYYRLANGQVTIASQPTDDEPGWQSLPSGELAWVDRSLDVHRLAV